MPRQLWIPRRLAEFGVTVHVVDGWETRGNESFNPRGGVIHHDAFKATVDTRSAIGLLVHGRPGVPGPLCNVWLDDDNNDTPVKGDPVAYVISAGRANHAGKGGWKGLSGNSSVWGVEARGSGQPGDIWSERMMDAYHRVAAALTVGSGHQVDTVCAHREWAPGRKVDPYGVDMAAFRRGVANVIATHGGTPPPPPPPPDPHPELVKELLDDQAISLTVLMVATYDRYGSGDRLPTIRPGATGDGVRMLQGTLRWLTNSELAIDGVYGPNTQQMVRNLQNLGNVTVDGVVGPNTWRTLRFFVAVESKKRQQQ